MTDQRRRATTRRRADPRAVAARRADPGRRPHRAHRADDRRCSAPTRPAGRCRSPCSPARSFAGIVAIKNGHTAARVRDAAIGGVSRPSARSSSSSRSARSSAHGTWPARSPPSSYYGIGLLTADVLLCRRRSSICALVGLAIGSSWTTAGRSASPSSAGADPRRRPTAIAAGAMISGAYFGDKMSPISETTILVPSLVGGVTTKEHIGAMLWTVRAGLWPRRSSGSWSSAFTPASGVGLRPDGAQGAPGRTSSTSR